MKTEKSGAQIWENADVAKFYPKRRANSHKGDYGTATVLGGGASVGASFLAAAACLKSGSGYTKFFLPSELYMNGLMPLVAQIPACMFRAFSGVEGELLSSDAIALGMGAGASERLYDTIGELLTSFRGTLVLDADALNALSAYGKEILKNRTCRLIVTPHVKEFSRLTGRSVGEILANAAELAKDFANEYGAVVALKSSQTVITDGDKIAINRTGSPALAKGGSGDVLSGFLVGTCARGVEPFAAACVSSYILGRAGEFAAEKMGEYSPDASDIIKLLPQAILSVL